MRGRQAELGWNGWSAEEKCVTTMAVGGAYTSREFWSPRCGRNDQREGKEKTLPALQPGA